MRKLTITFLLLFIWNCSFGQLNMVLQSHVTYNEELSDIWGYTDSLGREYALVCLKGSIAIENISDPANPQNVTIIPAPRSTWRDAKTYKGFAYFTNESSGGLQIIDLKNLPNAPDTTDITFWSPALLGLGQLTTCHNIYIDTATGYGYLAGCDVNNGGILIIDLFTNPGNPSFVAAAAARYAHDVYARDGYIYGSDIYDGFFSIQDARNLDSIVTLGTQQSPFNFTHNTWLSDDGKTIFTTDETQNAPVGAYDISDFNDIKYLDEFRPIASINTGLIPHNVHVKNDYLVTSFYTEGIIITDAHRPQNLIEVGNYDTFNGPNGNYNGVWGTFPFFDSGIIIGSDIGSGLYVLQPTYQRASYLEGIVRDSSTGALLDKVSVKILSDDQNGELSNISGEYKTGQVTTGTFLVEYTKVGYYPKQVEVTLASGEVTLMNVVLVKDDRIPSPSILTNMEQGCAPFQLALAPSEIDNSFTYQWNIVGPVNFELLENTPSIELPTVGDYTVTLGIKQADGTVVNVAEQHIKVIGSPKINFEVLTDGKTITTVNNTEGGTSFIWEFGDETRSEEITPSHTYAEAGLYTIELTAFNACSGTTSSQNIMILTTSLEDLGIIEKLDSYPNPFQEQFQIHYQLKDTPTKASLIISDLLGRVIAIQQLDNKEGVLSIGKDWETGVYLVQLQIEEQLSNPFKVIKTGK